MYLRATHLFSCFLLLLLSISISTGLKTDTVEAGAAVQLPSYVRDDAAMQIIDTAEDSEGETQDFLRRPFAQGADGLGQDR